jgi:hypothetical protein
MKSKILTFLYIICLCSYLTSEGLDIEDIYITGMYSTNNSNLFYPYYFNVADSKVHNIPIPDNNERVGISVSFLSVIDEIIYIGGTYGDQAFIYRPSDSFIEILPKFNDYAVGNVCGIFKVRDELYIYGDWYSKRSFFTREASDLYSSTIPHSFYYKLGVLEPVPIPNSVNAIHFRVSSSVIFNDDVFFCGNYTVGNKTCAYYYLAGEEQLYDIPVPENAVFSCANGIIVHNENLIITGHFLEDMNEGAKAFYYIVGEESIALIPSTVENLDGTAGLAIIVNKDDAYILGQCRINNVPMSYYYKVGNTDINIIPESENIYMSNAFTKDNNVYFVGFTLGDVSQLCYYNVGTNILDLIPPFENIERIQVNGANFGR